MSMFGIGNNFDGSLGSKIDQLLAGRPSAKQRVEDFLVEELHVDPNKIPLSLNEACKLINERMGERDAARAEFRGSTMGLSHVEFIATGEDRPSGACPLCSNQYAYFVDQGNGNWECDECNNSFPWTKAADSVTRYDERKNAPLFAELTRIYISFLKNVEPTADGDAPDCEGCGASNAGSRRAPHLCEVCEKAKRPKRAPAFTKFTAVHSYNEATVTGVADKKPRWKRPNKYPTDTTMRVVNGDESHWVRIGGLFSDDDVTILATMKPITNPTAWTVVEVLDD